MLFCFFFFFNSSTISAWQLTTCIIELLPLTFFLSFFMANLADAHIDIIRHKSNYNGPSTFVGLMTGRGKLKFPFMNIVPSILKIVLHVMYGKHLRIFVGPFKLWPTRTIITFHPYSDGPAYFHFMVHFSLYLSSAPCWFN